VFPWIYEFHWSAGHLIFLGIFFSVMVVIATSVAMAALKAWQTFRDGQQERVQWVAEFKDLPLPARACRHELTREVQQRTCNNEFDCRGCETHGVFLSRRTPGTETEAENGFFGFSMPLDRFYHRGHAWAKFEGEGVYSIGLDDFGSRLIGVPDCVELPSVGSRVRANGTGWQMVKQKSRLRILAPIDGVVVEQGSGSDWYLKVRVDDQETPTRHLLQGEEVRPWLMREMERLQYALAPDGIGASLADGGELLPEAWRNAPEVDWDGVWGEMFLRA
jgi:glycine cleavage system H lipoate-binding protein